MERSFTWPNALAIRSLLTKAWRIPEIVNPRTRATAFPQTLLPHDRCHPRVSSFVYFMQFRNDDAGGVRNSPLSFTSRPSRYPSRVLSLPVSPKWQGCRVGLHTSRGRDRKNPNAP